MTRILTLKETTDPAAVADQAVLYSKDVGGVTRVFSRNSDGTITAVDGGGNFALPEVWAYPNVAANLTAASMSPQISGFANVTRMARPGSIIGVVAQLSETITAGSLTINITKNGTPVTLALVLTTGTGGQSVQASGVDTYVAGDLIGVTITTNAGFLPTTTDLETWVEVAEGVSSPGPTGGGGGYKGVWTSGSVPYLNGSIVRKGPFVFGATADNSVNPCDAENVADASKWSLQHSGGGLQSGNVVRLVNNTVGQQASIYRQATFSTWAGKRQICDLLAGPSGGADIIAFGFFDSSLAQTSVSVPFATGFYGVVIDIYNTNNQSAVGYIANGTVGGLTTVTTSGQITGNEILETTRFYRFYADFVESGANLIVTLWRDCYDLNTAAGIEVPGFLGTWTFTKPSFTTCRAAAGAQSGGIAGNFKIRSLFTLDRSGVWDMLNEFAHPPRIDTALFWP